MKKFVTEDSFWQLFPGASLGVIVARGMKPANEISPKEDVYKRQVVPPAWGAAC